MNLKDKNELLSGKNSSGKHNNEEVKIPNGFTLGKKMIGAFIILLSFMAVVFGITIKGYNTQINNNKILYEEELKQSVITNLRFSTASLIMFANDFLITEKNEYIQKFKLEHIQNEAYKIDLKDKNLSKEEITILYSIESNLDSIYKLANNIFSIKHPKFSPLASEIMETLDYRFGDTINLKASEFSNISTHKIGIIISQSEITEKRMINLRYILFIFTLFICFFVIYISIQKISKPIKKLMKSAMAIANGNYTQLPVIKTNDEIGLLSYSFSQMVDAIQKSNDELKESEIKLRSAFESISDVLITININGIIHSVNKQTEILFGYTVEEIINQPIGLLLPDNFIETHIQNIEIIQQQPKLHEMNRGIEIVAERKDGTSFLIEITLNPYKIKNDEMILCVLRDITERKQSEKDLFESKEKAEESNRLKSAFLMNMSHEIRTPMNGILGFVELLKEKNLNDEQKNAYFNIVKISGHRLLNTINDIIEISKIEAGESDVNIEMVNVEEILQFQYDFFKPQTDEKGLKLEIAEQITGVSALIETDKHKLEGILTNLTKNAIKFTTNGAIRIGNYIDDSSLVFYVKDTGRGIPSDKLEVIFNCFVQADLKLTRAHEGSGLGLSIVKGYLDAMGGKIWVETEFGKGTAFFISIPYRLSFNINKPEDNFYSIPDSISPEITILIAEDDDICYMCLKSILKKEGITHIRTTNGEDTIKVLKENPDISFILMDIKMPVMNGLEATRQIRLFNKTIPIVVQSAHAFPEDKTIAFETGCNDYITKPINHKELMKMISKYTVIENVL